MNIEKEIVQLKYQIKLLKFMVNEDDFPFFMYALDHDFEESQVNALLKVLSAFKYRLNKAKDNTYGNSFHESIKEDESLKLLLKTYQIEVHDIYKNALPNIAEFRDYLNSIFADKEINSKHLLMSLKKQSIHKNLCEDLLNQLEEL
ncbi:DUF1878 family protein [Oceanobacillus bengalensis]|uniref:DUF1878 family protein n=1 Tax=Oceanobacillus bengalensis TaxID=1435466 RepID=A0A494YR30_9BACI|nr:DUF1878 family protein [Oceanobacillus bengalensis]RKQ11311.1 DUF1878 family protein [Oceanobacillus bengalensis]